MLTKIANTFFDYFLLTVGAILFAFLFQIFLFQPYQVSGSSMNPTFEDKDKLFINKFVYDIGQVQKGDIVVFKADEDTDYIKRVIATEGDKVSVVGNEVFVNGEKIQENYISTPTNNPSYLENNFVPETIVPQGSLFVLGDNRENSNDSRAIGFVDENQVKGKVVLRYTKINNLASY